MIPTDDEIVVLWEKYHLPDNKKIHSGLVARTAMALATRLSQTRPDITICMTLLHAAALLHDIDKNIPKHPGEKHPDAGVRALTEEGLTEVAELISKHPLHRILEAPSPLDSWEAKLLFLADKMVKYDILTVDKRFDLWRAESMNEDAVAVLTSTYSKVKELEKEIFGLADLTPEEFSDSIRSNA